MDEKYEYLAAAYSISKLLYLINQQREIQNKQIQYDVSPLIDLALSTNDKEWFLELTAKLPLRG